ncbi:hypothetical protein ACEQ8H_005214 [Pleosporales sp. CAS-2024a]
MAHLATPTSNAPLTPSDEPSPITTTAPEPQPITDFSPATVPYDESFENDLMNLILHPPSSPTPRHPDPPPSTPPLIPPSQLPIPLSSLLRAHPSPLPGLLLTHPNGYHTGGPGPSAPTLAAFADKMAREQGVRRGDVEGVKRALEARVEDLKRRMGERDRAVRRNRELDDELEKLRLQRDDEVRVLEKMKGRR